MQAEIRGNRPRVRDGKGSKTREGLGSSSGVTIRDLARRTTSDDKDTNDLARRAAYDNSDIGHAQEGKQQSTVPDPLRSKGR